MSLNIFFDPVDEKIYEDIDDTQAFYYQININSPYSFPNWQESRIVIIGITEERGTPQNKGVAAGCEEIRKKLYRLNKGNFRNDITDLGDLRNGLTLEDTYLRLGEVCSIMLQHDITIIIIGGSQDLTIGQYMAFEELQKRISVLNIDAKIDMHTVATSDKSQNFVQQIITHQPNYLFNYIHLAYQTYLTDNAVLSNLEKLHFDLMRLGKVKESIYETEPTIREADMMTFDIGAVKMVDAPGNVHAQAFGLTAEEACQLCWYAGSSNKMKSAGFFEYNAFEDNRFQTASVIATMIWYFIDGIYTRKNELHASGDLITKYFVSLEKHPYNLVFYKHKLNEKWWMEVPYQNEPDENYIVSCSYKDYTDACEGELPDRWINTYARLI